jgi:hypothetical protein
MAEEAPFEVVATYDDLEVRRYPPIIIAMVEGMDENEAFGHLFRYISGRNEGSDKIAMTVPVISNQPRGRRLAMTVPVISDKRRMSFVLPKEYRLNDLPRPLDPKVRIDEVAGRVLAVVRFRGYAREKDVEEKKKALMEAVKHHGLKAIGETFEMYYNGPGTPGFMRRNEVAVEVEAPEPS